MNNMIRFTVSAMALAITAFANTKLEDFAGPVSVRTSTAISSKTAQAGTVWVGSISQDVIRDGRVVLRQGTPVEGVMDDVVRKNGAGEARLSLRLTSIDGQAVNSSSLTSDGEVKARKASRTVTGWAITGALVGGVLHGGKGAAAGAAAGAGIGALRAGSKVKSDAVIPAESVVTFEVKN